MNQASALHRISRRPLPGAAAVGLLFATFGCADTTPPGTSENGILGKDQAAQTPNSIYILNSTNSTITNLTLTFEASNGATHYLDWERVKGTLYPKTLSPKNHSFMRLGDDLNNELQETYFGQGYDANYTSYSFIRIDDYSFPRFPLGKLKINGDVGGVCFEDWEVIDWQTPPLLYINASGGALKGNCKVGNFLRPWP